jgi:hypothetical protein
MLLLLPETNNQERNKGVYLPQGWNSPSNPEL